MTITNPQLFTSWLLCSSKKFLGGLPGIKTDLIPQKNTTQKG